MNAFLPILIAALLLSFALSVIFVRILIPKLKSRKMGQKILDIGPRWHKSKEGTPTMGGLGFIAGGSIALFAALILMQRLGVLENSQTLLKILFTYGLGLLMGVVGFLDDFMKFFKNQNEGFSAKIKFLLQLIVGGGYLAAMKGFGLISTRLYIPYLDKSFELGVLYYVIALFLIAGIVNSVNLTDGLDGLAASVTLFTGIFFTLAFCLCGEFGASVLPLVMIGGCAGFLVYNFYPAKIFMGDTGSLFLGGLCAGFGFLIDNPLIILVCGIIYVMESASDIIQVGYYKMTHKRIFKMAPIHHHFEKCGWSEVKIVGVFSFITVIAGAVAYFGL